MLLDQKKTKRMVRIVSILGAVGFVGVLPVVLLLVIFTGGNSAQDAANRSVQAAEAAVQASPRDVSALVNLANQYRAANRPTDAAATMQRAVAVGARNNDELAALLTGLSDSPSEQLQVLKSYTASHPKDAQAFLTYGTAAERAGQIVTARLALQRAVQTAPKGSLVAQQAKQALDRVLRTPTPTTPATPATPATP